MRTGRILQWVACLALVVEAAPARSLPAIDIYGVNPATGQVEIGFCQGSVIPGGEPLRLSIYALLGNGVEGLSGAEFFVYERGWNGEDRNNIFVPVAQGGLGWSALSTPNPLASATLGDAFSISGVTPDTYSRAQIAFPVTGTLPSDGCQVGDADAPPGFVKLYDVSISKATTGGPIPDDTLLWVGGGDPPSNPNFPCPRLITCDAPIFTVVCVVGGQFLVNPVSRDCGFAVATKPWGSIKALYR